MSKSDIVFLTFYDLMCLGARLLSSIVKSQGLTSHTIYLKDQAFKPIFTKKLSYQAYQFRYNGLLWGSCYAASPITAKEITLLLELLEDLSPSIICLSTRTFALELCTYLIPQIKERFPHIDIIAGGWGPTLEPEKFLAFSDYVCFGEGETPMVHICKSIKEKSDLKNIPNLMHKDQGGHPVCREYIKPLTKEDMDSFPFPDMGSSNKYLINKDKLLTGPNFENKKVYDIFAARGCPLNCSYCLSSKYSHIYKEKTGQLCSRYRVRSIDLFFEELALAKNAGARFIRIKDEVFPVHTRWIEQFLIRYPKEINLPFFGYVRPEFHSPEILKKLKDAGLSMTVAAIQSGADEIRSIYRRNFSKEKMIKFAKTLNTLNISFMYHFMYANPFENEEHLVESLKFSYELPCAKSFLFKLEPLPGTPLKERIDKEKPQGLPSHISEWHALLLSMSLQSKILRAISKYILKYNIFKHRPYLLVPFFLVSIISEIFSYLKRKIFLGTKSANVKA